jgi:hypothetical protein
MRRHVCNRPNPVSVAVRRSVRLSGRSCPRGRNATASQFWFLALALATAASVRTLALVEVLFAQAISRFVFKQPVSARDGLGIVMIVIGRGAAGVVILTRRAIRGPRAGAFQSSDFFQGRVPRYPII